MAARLRPEAGLAERDALLQTAWPTLSGRSPPPAAARPRLRLPRKPGSAERARPRRRREPHWACSALAGSGARRWEAPAPGGGARNPHREEAEARAAAEVGARSVLQSSPGGHGEQRPATTRVAQRCQVSAGTGRASLGGGLR